MSKFYLGLAVVSAVLFTEALGAMKGGQILKQPLPYTVYILTRDRDDVFYFQKFHRQSYRVHEGGNTTGRTSPVGDLEAGSNTDSTTSQAAKRYGTSASEEVTRGGEVTNDKGSNEERGSSPRIDRELPSSSTAAPIQNENKDDRTHSTTGNVESHSVKLWRYCMGVIFDELTILTADICIVKAEGLHSFISVNETNHDSAQEVTIIADGRNHFDVRVIRLNKNQSMPGLVPDWQDEDTVYWKLEELSNSSSAGIVPSYGYPPMVAALKLLPMDTCKRIYDELLELYPAHTATLPGILQDTVVCATQADKPIDFPDGVGLVQPGLACPDSLGAPLVLLDGTVLGVLVAADCKDKNVAFFQTLGKGMPYVEEEDEVLTPSKGIPTKHTEAS